MTSRVELEIAGPQAQVAELFADPRNIPEWMDEVERIDPITGELGQPGSAYRMVPKRGGFVFDATVVKRTLPTELRLSLQARRVTVAITDTFLRLSDRRTRLISEEVFTFKGLLGRLMGFLGRRSIAAAHRRHMESFKRFAEGRASDAAR